MRIFKHFIQIFTVSFLILVSPIYVYASNGTPPHLQSLVGVFGTIIGLLYDFVALAMFVILTINGIKYLFSGVNPDQKAAASKGLTYAFIGLFIIAISYIIVVFIIASFINGSFASHVISGSQLQFSLGF